MGRPARSRVDRMTLMVTPGLDRWSPLRLTEYRTRLTGLLDPTFNDEALAEAIAAFLYSRLINIRKTGARQNPILAKSSLVTIKKEAGGIPAASSRF